MDFVNRDNTVYDYYQSVMVNTGKSRILIIRLCRIAYEAAAARSDDGLTACSGGSSDWRQMRFVQNFADSKYEPVNDKKSTFIIYSGYLTSPADDFL